MPDANPILYNPYEAPARHYATTPEGEIDGEAALVDLRNRVLEHILQA